MRACWITALRASGRAKTGAPWPLRHHGRLSLRSKSSNSKPCTVWDTRGSYTVLYRGLSLLRSLVVAPSLNVYYATGKWERGLYWWGEGPADGRTVGRYTGVAIKAKALATAVRHSSPSFIMSGCNARGQPGYVDGKHAGPSYLQCINDFLNTGVSINACFGERRELALIRPISWPVADFREIFPEICGMVAKGRKSRESCGVQAAGPSTRPLARREPILPTVPDG